MVEEALMSARLRVTGITKRYGDLIAVNNVSFDLNPDEIVAIIGPNAAGKSTLLKCITALEDADSGDGFLDGDAYLRSGKLTRKPEELRSRIVTVLQSANLFPTMNVLENLTFALTHVHGASKRAAEDEAVELARKLDVGDILLKYPNEISGGQAQKISIGRAVLMKPKVLLLDEITSALSPTSIIAVIDALNRLKSEGEREKLSIVIVTHLMKFATEYADHVLFMSKGRVAETGPAASFFETCRSDEAKAFIAANRIPF